MSTLPFVALVGQTNAGKSSLLNRFAHKNIAIVAREEGTTRDNVMTTIDHRFILVDTAGLKDPADDFEASIQDQIQDAIDAAAVILVTLDSTKYFDHRDARIAKEALKSQKPIFLILNKSDLRGSLPLEEFRALGIPPEQTFYVSATTGAGIPDLKTAIIDALEDQNPSELGTVARARRHGAHDLRFGPSPKKPQPQKDSGHSPIKLALIGRPNVGKSSLFNALGQKQQALVSSRQGTTRDINRVTVKYKGQAIEILDTAGLRRQGKREVGIEKFSALRTLAAIEEADVCALLVDSTEPHAKLDQSLAGQIVDAGKGIIMVVTKSDLLDPVTIANYYGIENPEGRAASDMVLDQLERDFDFLPYAPVLLTSSETGANVTKLFDLILEVNHNRHIEIKTSDLNRILADAIMSHPPAGLKNTRPKPKYIVQTDVCPPWFVVHGRDLGLLHWSWKRFLERKIREKYPLVGTPIKFSFRSDRDKIA